MLFLLRDIPDHLGSIFVRRLGLTNTLCSNAANATSPLTVSIESAWSAVNGTIIIGELNGYNYLNNQTEVVPVPLNISSTAHAANESWAWDVPAYSITVLQFQL